MKNIVFIIVFIFTYLTSNSQSDTISYCKNSDSIFVYSVVNDGDKITYSTFSTVIEFKTKSNRIDTILNIIVNNDTIDRFKESEIKDFEEILPFLEIPDWELLLKLHELYPYEERHKKYKSLSRTYIYVCPHLFGVFSNDIALIKTNKGYNFINREGEIQFSCNFENATNFINGVAIVKKKGKWYELDLNGKLKPK